MLPWSCLLDWVWSRLWTPGRYRPVILCSQCGGILATSLSHRSAFTTRCFMRTVNKKVEVFQADYQYCITLGYCVCVALNTWRLIYLGLLFSNSKIIVMTTHFCLFSFLSFCLYSTIILYFKTSQNPLFQRVKIFNIEALSTLSMGEEGRILIQNNGRWAN